MATNFALAVSKMVRERDQAFLERIATDYSLDLKELEAKYMETADATIKVKRPYKKREPKTVEVITETGEKVQVPVKKDAPEDKAICQAQTSKKEPCKFSALKGGCFCKRHQRQHDEEQNPEAKKQKTEPAQKQEQPVHTHPLDSKEENCELCSSHGNALESDEEDFEVVLDPMSGEPMEEASAEQRLATMMEELYESEEDEE
jgi:hypothetical protein